MTSSHSELARRVRVRLAFLGLSLGDLADAVEGSANPRDRWRLGARLNGRRMSRGKLLRVDRPAGWLEQVAKALNVDVANLEDGAEWTPLVAPANSHQQRGED